MPQGTQAEIFIETLTEMIAEERTNKAVRKLQIARAQAERFLSRSFDVGTDSQSSPGRLATRVAEGLSQTL